jgi:hypothetical protein
MADPNINVLIAKHHWTFTRVFLVDPVFNTPSVHYDWWMFPLLHHSKESPTAQQYALHATDSKVLQQLIANPVYMAEYIRGIELYVIAEYNYCKRGGSHYAIRTAKMRRSIKIFTDKLSVTTEPHKTYYRRLMELCNFSQHTMPRGEFVMTIQRPDYTGIPEPTDAARLCFRRLMLDPRTKLENHYDYPIEPKATLAENDLNIVRLVPLNMKPHPAIERRSGRSLAPHAARTAYLRYVYFGECVVAIIGGKAYVADKSLIDKRVRAIIQEDRPHFEAQDRYDIVALSDIAEKTD